MLKRIEGKFCVRQCQRRCYAGPGGELVSSCVVARGFSGEISGTSLCEAAEVRFGEQRRRAVCVGVEELDVEFDGLTGSFFLVYSRDGSPLDFDKPLSILSDSGTRDLRGISGVARFLPEQGFLLDYRLH